MKFKTDVNFRLKQVSNQNLAIKLYAIVVNRTGAVMSVSKLKLFRTLMQYRNH